MKRLFPSQGLSSNQTGFLWVSGYSTLPFRWFEYLKDSKSLAAPVHLFNKVRLKQLR